MKERDDLHEDNDDEPDEPHAGDFDDNLSDIDRQIRINELKERARELAGGEFDEGKQMDLPPELEEKFWEHVVAFESADFTTGIEKLQDIGVELTESDELEDAQLPDKLREIIGAMASLRMYLLHTDHLSDRELYEALVDDVLMEESPDMPMDSNGAWMIDLVSSGSDEDTNAYLRYYADETFRQEWARDFPEDTLPAHEELPYNRDTTLPQPVEPGEPTF